ncbi:hypothetical protein [Larkinella rosea]|uniref:hypothetical protein n=1 Tax=Larkinella rosea TaxID=2025312 RepID=UPI00163962DC|nr:hypothetical protein [Larkinella rosea]
MALTGRIENETGVEELHSFVQWVNTNSGGFTGFVIPMETTAMTKTGERLD